MWFSAGWREVDDEVDVDAVKGVGFIVVSISNSDRASLLRAYDVAACVRFVALLDGRSCID